MHVGKRCRAPRHKGLAVMPTWQGHLIEQVQQLGVGDIRLGAPAPQQRAVLACISNRAPVELGESSAAKAVMLSYKKAAGQVQGCREL